MNQNKANIWQLLLALLILPNILMAKPPRLSTSEALSPPPRIIRTCCAFGAEVKMKMIPFKKFTSITSIDQIGSHEYLGNKTEGNGIIYTHRGGFIDLGHLRDVADWTAYLYANMARLPEGVEILELILGNEGGKKRLQLKDLDQLNEREKIQLSGRIAYDLSVWHEIATWFGVSYLPFVPERYSSFSPEDLYSNALGVKIAIAAISSPLPYEEALTNLLEEALDELGAVTTLEETYEATEAIRNIWWSNEHALPSKDVLIQRYYGNTKALKPWLIPADERRFVAKTIALPTIWGKKMSSFYKLSINLNRKFPEQLWSLLPDKQSITQSDFPEIVAYIKGDVLRQRYKKYLRPKQLMKRQSKEVHFAFYPPKIENDKMDELNKAVEEISASVGAKQIR